MTPRTAAAFRTCATCGESKCWPASFAKPRGAKCKRCKADEMAAWAKANRPVRTRAAIAARRARVRAANETPFDTTLHALEAQWGKYATWTRDQHARHSEILRRMAGIDDDAPSREERAA